MRNNIYRSFLKKVLKSEAFVSLAIVFVLALGIIGTSYALYMDVDTDTDYQLVKVGDLDVYIGFDNGDNTVTLSNVTPTDDEIALESTDNVFSFYIYNGGNYTADYSIKLVPDYSTTDNDGNTVTANEIKPEYIRFQICKDNARNCKDVENLSDFVTVDENNNITESKEIYVDELSPKKENEPTNPSAYYFIRMWLTSEGYGVEGSGYDEAVIGKTIKYKVNVEAKNASGLLDNTNTLAGKLLSDDRVTINNTIPDFSVAETEEKGLYKAEDDYGISYYYRGAQSYNYVSFAGFTWKVVRINGDGSIRLILDGNLYTSIKDGEETPVYTNSKLTAIDSDGFVPFNTLSSDNAYTGYMYGSFETNSTSYDEAHANINDSKIKQYLDVFYEEYILPYHNDYIADALFCGDKTRIRNYTSSGYGISSTYYGSYLRSGESNPTLECALRDNIDDINLTDEQLAYSRYTSISDQNTRTTKGVLVNNDLKYPIALLSADEEIFMGACKQSGEEGTDNNYWLMSPAYYNGVSPLNYASDGINIQSRTTSGTFFVRPVINLKADILWASGDGTADTPYEVKLY